MAKFAVATRSNWFRTNVLIAVLALVAVALNLYFSQHLLSAYDATIERNKTWILRIKKLVELGQHAASIGSPAHEALIAGDLTGARTTLIAARSNFEAAINDCRSDASAKLEPSQALAIFSGLNELEEWVKLMAADAENIFTAIGEKNYQVASTQDAMLARHYAQFNESLVNLRNSARSLQAGKIEEEKQQAIVLQRIESVIAAIVAVLMVCAVASGIRTAGELAHESEEREKNFQRLQISEKALRESEERFRNAFDYSAIGMALVAVDGRFLKVNRSLCEIVGYAADELLKIDFQTITHPDDLNADLGHLKELLAGTTSHYEMEKRYFHKQGSVVWILLTVTLVRDPAGNPMYFVSQIQDITVRKHMEEAVQASLREKELLLREVHHRVKNNMQVITSLLNLQSIEISDPATLRLFNDTEARVKSMALIHEKLYQSVDLARIDFNSYIENLMHFIFRSYGVDSENIQLETRLNRADLNLDEAIPCGLILNELASNALKHAFPSRRGGVVRVELDTRDSAIHMSVADNGVGLPDNFSASPRNSLGMRLVAALSEQLHGTMTHSRENGWTKFAITFAQTTGLKGA